MAEPELTPGRSPDWHRAGCRAGTGGCLGVSEWEIGGGLGRMERVWVRWGVGACRVKTLTHQHGCQSLRVLMGQGR